MKNLSMLFIVVVVLCASSFAQKKAAFNPCASKNPKVRAAAKKPCPSAPDSKKNSPVEPPKSTDNGGTADDNDDSNDLPSDKTGSRQNPSPKNKKPQGTADDSSGIFFITIESDGEKTEIACTQFESRGGQAMMENEQSNHPLIGYGASNSTSNDENFSFQGRLPAAVKGTFSQGEDRFNFSFETTRFSKYRILLCASASYDITAMPQAQGIAAKHTKFVEGTFTCSGESYEDGGENKIQYTMTGRFKLPRFS